MLLLEGMSGGAKRDRVNVITLWVLGVVVVRQII